MSADGGPENKGLVENLQQQWGINRVISSAYHPQGQGLIERGHAPIVAALKKLRGNWVDNLANVLWADRTTVKRSTQETPAYLVSGREHILPVELSIPTWQTLPWSEVKDTPTLLAMRAQQFQRRDKRFQEAINRTVRLRQENKDYFDDAKVLRKEPLAVGDLVLLRDSFHKTDRSTLTKFLPNGPVHFALRNPSERMVQSGRTRWDPIPQSHARQQAKAFHSAHCNRATSDRARKGEKTAEQPSEETVDSDEDTQDTGTRDLDQQAPKYSQDAPLEKVAE
ncbi:hypothetical protein P3342_002805 [Pyrenophora teres f. teres]|nr:hypothetical protein P3342_002805 [Pyrenophora teres f. teres]